MAIPANRPLSALICALGVAQIISWGSLYYSIAVLGAAIEADLGVSSTVVFGAFTLSLFVSGLVAPTVGRKIDELGGRRMLIIGSMVGASSLLFMSLVQGPITLFLAAAVTGVAISLCLYEATFITLNQISGDRYRTAVTAVTLLGGFASTAFWPLSQWLLDLVGWRWTLAAYAGLQLVVCLPLHTLLPAHAALPSATPATANRPDAATSPAAGIASGRRYHFLALAFAAGSFVLAALSVHIITLLKASGLTAAQAVLVATLIGPMQVLVRLLEFGFARQLGPVGVGVVTFLLMIAATVALYFVDGYSALAFIAAGLCGFSNGAMTIIRGTVPAVLFGRQGYGLLLGRLARPAFTARSLAPFAFSAALTFGIAHGNAVLLLSAGSLIAAVCYLRAISTPANSEPR